MAIAGAAVAAPWYVHYENGQQALNAGDERRAVTELGEAISRRADSGLRLRTDGTRLIDYFPYLMLGLAYTELGDYDAALQAFDTEEQLGLIVGVPGAKAHLDQARARAVAGRDRAAEEGQALVERRKAILRQSLDEARALRDRGLFDDAMRALASGLAVSPDDAEAVALMNELRNAATRTDDASRALSSTQPSSSPQPQAPTVPAPPAPEGVTDAPTPLPLDPELARQLSAAESDLAQGRSESALSLANRVLATDRGNRAALEIVQRAYAEISRRLLGTPLEPGQTTPPAIRFANPRSTLDGELVERVAQADYVLSGVAIGRSPITVDAFAEAGERRRWRRRWR